MALPLKASMERSLRVSLEAKRVWGLISVGINLGKCLRVRNTLQYGFMLKILGQ
jgi:hypothetical protein